MVARGRSHIAIDEVQVVEDSRSCRMAAVVMVDIVKADRVVGQELSPQEDMAAEEAAQIGQQEACKLVEGRSESQPGASCPVLQYAFPFAVSGRDAATANV